MRKKFIIALTLIFVLCFGSMAYAQCDGGTGKKGSSMGRKSRTGARRGRRRSRGRKAGMANKNAANTNQ